MSKHEEAKTKPIKIKPLDKAWYALTYGRDFYDTVERVRKEQGNRLSNEMVLIGQLLDALEGIHKHLDK